jgi:hypothetical protein
MVKRKRKNTKNKTNNSNEIENYLEKKDDVSIINDASVLNDTDPATTKNAIAATSTPTSSQKRTSASIATANLSNMARANRHAPSTLRLERAKISRLNPDEFAEYFEKAKKKVL